MGAAGLEYQTRLLGTLLRYTRRDAEAHL